MNQKNFTVDPAKKELYQRELEICLQKYKDKKSELKWADDEFEESVIQQEMDTYANKIRNLKQALSRIASQQQSA